MWLHSLSVVMILMVTVTLVSAIFNSSILFDEYLAHWYLPGSNKREFIVVNHLKTAGDNCTQSVLGTVNADLADYLQQINVSFYQYDNISTDALIASLKTKFEFKELLLLFDFSSIKFWPTNYDLFGQYLSGVDQIYWECYPCKSLVLLFDTSIQQLNQWSTALYGQFHKDFRSVLLSTQPTSLATPTAVHINPVINGCFQRRGIFVPTLQSHFNQLHIPFRKCDLNSTTLNVVVNHELPYCNIIMKGGKIKMEYSIEFELLKLLMRIFNFKVNLIYGNQSYGVFVNGYWTGVVGHVFNRSAHFGMCSISCSLQRWKAVDFSTVNTDAITFMTVAPEVRVRQFMVARPFSFLSWTSIWISFLLLSITIYAMIFVTTRWTLKQLDEPIKLTTIATKLFAILLNQHIAFHRHDKYNSTRIIYGVWLLVAIVLSYGYTGIFYSILALTEFESPVDTIEEFENAARNDTVKVITFTNSFTLNHIMHASHGFYQIVGKHMNRTKPKMVTNEQDVVNVFEEENSPPRILISSRIYLAFFRRVYSRKSMHISSDVLNVDIPGIIFPKKSPLYLPFNMMIEQTIQLGIVDKVLRESFYRVRARNPEIALQGNPTEKTRIAALNLKDLYSVILLWSIGMSLSWLTFVSEIVVSIMAYYYHKIRFSSQSLVGIILPTGETPIDETQ